jgi:hypothetical protein
MYLFILSGRISSLYGYLEPARLTQLSVRVLLSVVAEEHEVVGRQV